MCSRILLVLFLAAVACGPHIRMRKIASGELAMALSVADEEPLPDAAADNDLLIDSIRGSLSEGPIIMNAIRDSHTGEMVATDVIRASKVTARFRNVAERAGWVSLAFDISVPAGMADSRWQLKICPAMSIQEDTLALEPIYITGSDYRKLQLRGYERYRNFIAGIITDTTDFVRRKQLEIFLERHYPAIYAMKSDSSMVSEPLLENRFGVTRQQVLEHYRKHMKMWWNQRKADRSEEIYRKFVKDPIVREGIRLDTVLVGDEGDFIYRYEHTFRSRPRLKKVGISLTGSLYEKGERVLMVPFPEHLTFYISSLSSLADDRPRYKMVIMERTVCDNTKALIDFASGRSEIDTLLSDNASELKRIRRCIDDVVSRDELVLDSLVIVASCSPEGTYNTNRALSEARSRSVLDYMSAFVPERWRDRLKSSELPENWLQLMKLISSDTLIGSTSKEEILGIVQSRAMPDTKEEMLSRRREYRYLREKLYPQLRSVSFDFYLHRAGMVKDTIHTSQLDSTYMAGVVALKELDYKKAVEFLRPYRDFNSALAFVSADYDHSALDVLAALNDDSPKVCYLKAMVLSRLGQQDEALKYFKLAIAYDPYMEHRANLDPEMHALVNIYKQFKSVDYE